MSNVDLYSTHLLYLNEIFKIKGKLNNIVEFGMGNFSTDLLINNGENVLSIEMQSEEWYKNMFNKFSHCENWKSQKLIGPFEFYSIEYPEKIDLVFVDGHGDSRPECINFMMKNNCEIIVAHDTEELGYRWYKVDNNLNYMKIEFKRFQNWTTLWTTDVSLYEKMKAIM